MGKFWLHNMPDILQQGVGRGIVGLEKIRGWETRARGSGGLDRVSGLLKHHTASPPSWDWTRDIEYIAFTNPYAPSPISSIYHGRDGRIAIIAAGASNHGGSGGSYKPGGKTYAGVNRANYDLIGDEMGNSGTGEQWPWKQIMSSITSDALICLNYHWGSDFVFAHKEYCGPGTTTPGRKIDPFGPWENHPQRFWPDGSSWGPHQGNINWYRSLVSKKMAELSQETNVMHGFIPRESGINPRILDTRGPVGPHYDTFKLAAGRTVTINVPNGSGKGFAVVNLAASDQEQPGFFSAWASGPRPESSRLNWVKSQTIANEVTVDLEKDGTFQLFSPARTHVIIDLVGYYQQM
jgi:N-acetylmuramoyl-L-alanine amidase